MDFTVEQIEKARRLAASDGWEQVEFREGQIESLPVESGSVDCVISNGVINLCPDKAAVFAEAAQSSPCPDRGGMTLCHVIATAVNAAGVEIPRKSSGMLVGLGS